MDKWIKVFQRSSNILSHKRNANKNDIVIPSHPSTVATIKKTTANAGEDVGAMVSLYTSGGNVD
jgi:hypothetical protein